MSQQNKSTRPTHEILLSVWSVSMLIVNIYFDIFGGYKKKKKKKQQNKMKKKKSLDIFGVEKQRVYRISVTLSRSLKVSRIFLEELYNDPY